MPLGCAFQCGTQVFNELDNRDEADMLTLAAFFQTVCGRYTYTFPLVTSYDI